MSRSLLASLGMFLITFSLAQTTDEEAMRQARLDAKPWFVKNIQIGDTQLPVSPVTVGVLCLSLLYLMVSWSGKPVFVRASHILLKDSSDATRDKMEEWKDSIGSDAVKFSKYAAKYSECPTKSKGGKLGKFNKGAMVPPFDRLCFDKNTPVQTTIGPLQTQFGWHLIFIEERELGE